MSITKEKNKTEQQLPKWVINRLYRRGPFIFFLMGILPLCAGILFAILYIKSPKPKQLNAETANLSLEKSSFRDKSSLLHLVLDTLKLKAELSSAEEDEYLELVSFSKSFGQNELESLPSSNESLQQQNNKLIRHKKLLSVGEKIEVNNVRLSYLPNTYIQELSINDKVIIKKRNEVLFFMLWIVLPLLIGSYVIYLSFKFYGQYQSIS